MYLHTPTQTGLGWMLGPPPATTPATWTLTDSVRKALDLVSRSASLGKSFSADQLRRIRCMLAKINLSGTDDRIIRYHKLWAYADLIRRGMNDKLWDFLTTRATPDIAAIKADSRDAYALSVIENLDFQIRQGIWYLDYQHKNYGATMSPGMVQVKDWIRGRQLDPRSVYSCYT